MRGSRGLAAGVLAGACALGVAGCGGGERQDAGEPGGSFKLEVVDASFPTRQSIADPTTLQIAVRNADDKAVPNVAVTIATASGKDAGSVAFSSDSQDAGVADRSRPIWVVDRGPSGGDTAYSSTWALGRLKPGATRRFVWHLTAVKPGRYTVGYSVSPGLTGKAKLAGNKGKGSFRVQISDTPPSVSVDAAGNIVRAPGA
jgi:hypothetical protein